MFPYRKKPFHVEALRLSFHMKISNPKTPGKWETGKPGDYLLLDNNGGLEFITEKEIKEDYDPVDDKAKEQFKK